MSTIETPPPGLVLGSRMYDKIKFVAVLLLPALASLILAVGQIWSLDNFEKIALTVTAIDLTLGGLLKVSSKTFDKIVEAAAAPDGAFVVTTLPDGKKTVNLEFEQDPASLIDGRDLVFRVKEDALPDPEPTEEVPRGENLP